jgi:hypothetical protein
MRILQLTPLRRVALIALLGLTVLGATPTHAAPATKKQTSTIAFPGTDVGTWIGAGYGNWTQTEESMAVARQTCPTGGQFDGTVFRFFDLKGEYKKFIASGPPVLFNQGTPVGNFSDYDLDLYLFDAKCNRIILTGSNAGGAVEKQTTSRKPARYAVIVYWQGYQPNFPVTLEYS